MNFLSRFLIIILAFTYFSCGDKEATEADNLFKFKDYISYNTYGNISIADPIRVELVDILEQYDIDQELPSDFIRISPKTEGALYIENGRSLIFQPAEFLQPDTEYTVSLKLKKLYSDIDKEFHRYTFRFLTMKPNFKINLGDLQSYSTEWQYIGGTLEAADLIPLEKAKQLLKATQGNRSVNIKWPVELDDSKFFQFTIDSISRKIEDSRLNIEWNGKAINAENKGAFTFEIPGQNNFTIIDVKSSLFPEVSLSINFSDPIMEDQNFIGLVDIENNPGLRFEVDGNVLHVYPNQRIVGEALVTIFSGIKNTNGFGLKKEFSERISFEQIKPGVRLLSSGVILPNAVSTPFYFETVNLNAVDIRVIKIFEDNMLQFLQESNLNDQSPYGIKRVGRRIAKKTISLKNNGLGDSGFWKAHALNLSEYFNSDPGALYRIEISFKKEYIAYECNFSDSGEEEEDIFDIEDIAFDDSEENEERYWDNELYNWRNYSYNWSERDNPCHPAYYNEDRIITANVLGSDLGLIVKKSNNRSYHFAVNNILTTEPEGNVEILLYNYQQQFVGTATTTSDGQTIFDSDKNIAFAVAKKGNHYAYAKLEDGYALSLSKFDVSGKELQKGLKGFIYTERGAYRPGDDIHLTFVLNDIANPLPDGHPVKLEVTDARGKLVKRTVLNKGVNDFYYFPISTESNAPTGNWQAIVSVGGTKFYKSLKVATIKPNRLKLKLDFEDVVLDASKPIKGSALSTWLHGAPARNMKITIDVTLRSTNTAFENYPKYNFNDPIRTFDEVEVPLLDSRLSQEGEIDFSKMIEIGDKAPGMLKATFLTKVFEGGGDFSIDVFSKNLSPYSHFVGLNSPKAHRYGSYYTDEKTTFNVVSVDAQGNASPKRDLEVKVFKIEWRWWWNRGYDNLSRYENASIHRPMHEFNITTDQNGKGTFNLNIPEDEGGRYLIRVIDKVSGHATGRITYFYRNWWKSPVDGDGDNAKMLLFSADKEKYTVGENAVITFPSSSGGRALISIENGTEVLSTMWVETTKGETTVNIPLSKEMTPNVYVNISLLQPHEQTKNDLPIRLYGIIPVLVEDPNTVLIPEITMPDVLVPEESFSITVSEENNKEMTYTIAVVDEGLLDLTRFATPKIHEAFYTREALGVRTFDIYDYVIGAYSGSVENIFSIGGGDEAAGAKNRKADRFKPVVTYIGPFSLKAGKKATHEIQMPNYIGSVRTMVIAGDNSKSAYGKNDKTTPVRKALMVLASLPRKLSPGETVTLPVTVFAMENKIKKATISLQVGDALKPINGTTKTIYFDTPGEQIVNFEFEVLPSLEFQKIEVSVAGNGEKASYEVEIDVENPNPISQRTTVHTLKENESKSIDFETFGVPGSNGVTLEFSTLPPMDFSKRLEYLIRYPHGCVEQTTSSAFPQLYLGEIFDITFDKKKEIEENIKMAIKKLSRFQNTSGGMGYWPGESESNDWGTNYAGHFMLEAKEKGYALPVTFLSNWLRYQQNSARQWRSRSTSYNSSLVQAYRLYTLALAGKPELAAMNRLRENKHLSNDAKWRLSAAYAIIGKKEVARDIANTANIHFKPNTYDYYTYGSPFRNKAMALETLVAMGDPKQRDMAMSIANELSSQRWYSTQETAYALLALAKMVSKNGGKALDLTFEFQGKSNNLKTDKAFAQRDLPVQMGNNSISVSNNKGNVVYVTVSQKGKLPLGEELTERRNLSVKTRFLDGEGKTIDISSLRQGTEITAKITVSNTSNDWVDNIALTQIFPSGWEIVNTSFTDLGGGASGSARYTDIRDDRVNFYFDIPARRSKTFSVKLNASYLGSYYLPGTQVEAMYDNNYYARTKGSWIMIKE